MLWVDIIPIGRVTSDIVTGMNVTQFIEVGHIAKLKMARTLVYKRNKLKGGK